jgi:hypothetical protein
MERLEKVARQENRQERIDGIHMHLYIHDADVIVYVRVFCILLSISNALEYFVYERVLQIQMYTACYKCNWCTH